jgi:hypothetical protein
LKAERLGKKLSKESASNPHLDCVKPSFLSLALYFPMAALAHFGQSNVPQTNSVLDWKPVW